MTAPGSALLRAGRPEGTPMNLETRQGVGLVSTRHTTLFDEGLTLDCGRRLGPITVAWEQYGTPNRDRSNVILVCHALSGGAHAAGWHDGAGKPGWWDVCIGPGKAFDTDRYCVISSNVLESCYGTTGPSSIDPATGRPFGRDFPVVTISDMTRVQRRLLDSLGVTSLAAVAGGSMGGMQALAWAVRCPGFVRAVVALAATDRQSPQQIGFNEVARRAVMADPAWPALGLSVPWTRQRLARPPTPIRPRRSVYSQSTCGRAPPQDTLSPVPGARPMSGGVRRWTRAQRRV